MNIIFTFEIEIYVINSVKVVCELLWLKFKNKYYIIVNCDVNIIIFLFDCYFTKFNIISLYGDIYFVIHLVWLKNIRMLIIIIIIIICFTIDIFMIVGIEQ